MITCVVGHNFTCIYRYFVHIHIYTILQYITTENNMTHAIGHFF